MMDPDAQTSTSTLPLELPPELFPIIASFVPLRSAPRTLRALTLCNHRFYAICRPLLYSRLILRNEDDAIGVIQRILDEPQIGSAVTELYIMSELSAEARNGEKPFDVVAGLQMLVTRGLLPRLAALGLYLLKGWLYDETSKIIMHGRLLADFWISLRNECPRLRTLMLRHVGHVSGATWLMGPVIDEINALPGLSTLRLEWKGVPLSAQDDFKILNNLPHLASSLRTLSLNGKFVDATDLLSLDFPHLRWLRLHTFRPPQATETVKGFFRRHPHLESLSLERCRYPWFFADNIQVGLLPNLKHLKAPIDDIRALAAIIPQLVSLRFTEDYRRRGPQFLDAALEVGLPRLRALEMDHSVSMASLGHSLVNMFPIHRGAPNLEELVLHGIDFGSWAVVRTLKDMLSLLRKLERLYYSGLRPEWMDVSASPPYPLGHWELLQDFLSTVEGLARACASLKSVTSFNSKPLPYISGVIERDSVGDVTAVRLVDGIGMVIPADEDDPFPCNN